MAQETFSVRKKNQATIITDDSRREQKYELPIALSVLGSILAYGAYKNRNKMPEFVEILKSKGGQAGRNIFKKGLGKAPKYRGIAEIARDARRQIKRNVKRDAIRGLTIGATMATGRELASRLFDDDDYKEANLLFFGYEPSALEKLAIDAPKPLTTKIYDLLFSSPERAINAMVWVAATTTARNMLDEMNKKKKKPSGHSKARIIIEVPEPVSHAEQYMQAKNVKLAAEDLNEDMKKIIDDDLAEIIKIEWLDEGPRQINWYPKEGMAGRSYQYRMHERVAYLNKKEMEKQAASKRLFNKELVDSVISKTKRFGKMVFSETDEMKTLRKALSGAKDYVSEAEKALKAKNITLDNQLFHKYLEQEIGRLKAEDLTKLTHMEDAAKKARLLTTLAVIPPGVLLVKKKKKGEQDAY